MVSDYFALNCARSGCRHTHSMHVHSSNPSSIHTAPDLYPNLPSRYWWSRSRVEMGKRAFYTLKTLHGYNHFFKTGSLFYSNSESSLTGGSGHGDRIIAEIGLHRYRMIVQCRCLQAFRSLLSAAQVVCML